MEERYSKQSALDHQSETGEKGERGGLSSQEEKETDEKRRQDGNTRIKQKGVGESSSLKDDDGRSSPTARNVPPTKRFKASPALPVAEDRFLHQQQQQQRQQNPLQPSPPSSQPTPPPSQQLQQKQRHKLPHATLQRQQRNREKEREQNEHEQEKTQQERRKQEDLSHRNQVESKYKVSSTPVIVTESLHPVESAAISMETDAATPMETPTKPNKNHNDDNGGNDDDNGNGTTFSSTKTAPASRAHGDTTDYISSPATTNPEDQEHHQHARHHRRTSSASSAGHKPLPSVQRRRSSGSISPSSDLSSASSGQHQHQQHHDRKEVMSPTPWGYVPDVPPAPPSTPASHPSGGSAFPAFDVSTPLPFQDNVRNAYRLEREQQLAEGAVTPAPPQKEGPATASAGGPTTGAGLLSDDFSEWAVGDRYKLVRILGRGSYGEVAQAIDLHDGRSDAYVAIKRILSPFDQEVDAVRLYREIHILRRLCGHDCIIALLDVVQPPTDDLDDFHDLYLVFEYVDTDLYKLIMSPQYLTTEHIQTFLYQMLTGLKYLHSSSVIHRDLKPANILLNEDCSLKICDFGLARIVNRSLTSAGDPHEEDTTNDRVRRSDNFSNPPRAGLMRRQLTKHVVTRWYRAPELILIQPYTSAVDIWSLGCILAELLSMQEGSVPGYQDRKPLFPGGSCYPLSGEVDALATRSGNDRKTNTAAENERLDQLSVIFGIIGTPSPEDIAAAVDGGKSSGSVSSSRTAANDYIGSLKKMPGKPLEEIYPKADPSAIDLLKRMLKFNPKLRCTAEQALEHDFFKGVRRKELEREAKLPLVNPDFLEFNKIDLLTLKRKTYEEVLWYRDNIVGKKK